MLTIRKMKVIQIIMDILGYSLCDEILIKDIKITDTSRRYASIKKHCVEHVVFRELKFLFWQTSN